MPLRRRTFDVAFSTKRQGSRDPTAPGCASRGAGERLTISSCRLVRAEPAFVGKRSRFAGGRAGDRRSIVLKVEEIVGTVREAKAAVRTWRLKVRRESYPWLDRAAVEVNQVWNWANATSFKAARPFAGRGKFLSGFDLCNLSAGASECFEHIGADRMWCTAQFRDHRAFIEEVIHARRTGNRICQSRRNR